MFIRIKQAAKMLGVSMATVRRYADEKRIRSIRTLGGHRRVCRDDITRWLLSQQGSNGASTTERVDLAEVLERRLEDLGLSDTDNTFDNTVDTADTEYSELDDPLGLWSL